MGKNSGGGGTREVIQKTDSKPWGAQAAFLAGGQGIPHEQSIFHTANRLSQDPMSYFPGQTYSNFSPETEQALGLQAARATAGSPALAAANAQNAATSSGDYLSAGNPHFAQMAGRIRGQVLPAINGNFAAAGRSGSGLHGRAVGEGLGDAIGSLAYQNYNDERGRMMQAGVLAPGLANADYVDSAKLAEVGGVREDLEQQGINEAMARHEYGQMEPWQRLGLYNSMIQGNYGGTTSGTSTSSGTIPRRSVGTSAVGGALAGAGAGAAFGPWGAGIGAGLGLLGGLL